MAAAKSICKKALHLLDATDNPAFESLNQQADTPLMLICDHASNHVPKALNNMGLSDELLGQHIGYDIGVAEVTRQLSDALQARATLSGFSRLVIDANRYLSDASSMPAVSDQIEVPGNQNLDISDRMLRVEELFVPYHNEVGKQLQALQAIHVRPLLVSMHSFTPVFQGFERPWHIGVLWYRDEDVAQLVIEQLEQFDDWLVGNNEPYHACQPLGFSMETHAQQLGGKPGQRLPEVLFEVRQDLIETAAGQTLVAERLSRVLQAVLQTLQP